MILEVETLVEIPFHDVDAMQVVWHGNYYKYFEIARGHLLRRFEYDYPDMELSGYLWPIIDCKCRFVSPALYGMIISVTAGLKEWENRLLISYVIRDKATGKKICKGDTTQVAVNKKTGEMCFASPAILKEKLQGFLS
jgi:acyl-CoA thioester hydrolase